MICPATTYRKQAGRSGAGEGGAVRNDCYEPCYEPEGGYYVVKHVFGKDGYCIGCGLPKDEDPKPVEGGGE